MSYPFLSDQPGPKLPKMKWWEAIIIIYRQLRGRK
jgi:hypothetical protein